MAQLLADYEAFFRLSAFALVLLFMLLWETLAPRRRPGPARARRINNLALAGIDVILVRYGIPIATAAMAELARARGWGLFNAVDAGFWPTFCLSILLLDLLIYGQHVITHKIPMLWRLHRVHHTDQDIDVTTAVRFHPLEIILSAGLKLLFVALLGVPVVAVIIFEIILNLASMFNHSNINIPVSVDRVLRLIIVTPDMHRVHHSVRLAETNSNYGFNFPWWDRLFGTYRPQPTAGHTRMKIGLHEFRGPHTVFVQWLLVQPFLAAKPNEERRLDL